MRIGGERNHIEITGFPLTRRETVMLAAVSAVAAWMMVWNPLRPTSAGEHLVERMRDHQDGAVQRLAPVQFKYSTLDMG